MGSILYIVPLVPHQLRVSWFVRRLLFHFAFSSPIGSCECYPHNCVLHDSVHRKKWISGIVFVCISYMCVRTVAYSASCIAHCASVLAHRASIMAHYWSAVAYDAFRSAHMVPSMCTYILLCFCNSPVLLNTPLTVMSSRSSLHAAQDIWTGNRPRLLCLL